MNVNVSVSVSVSVSMSVVVSVSVGESEGWRCHCARRSSAQCGWPTASALTAVSREAVTVTRRDVSVA